MNTKNKKILHTAVSVVFLLANLLSFNTALAYSFNMCLGSAGCGTGTIANSTVSQMVTNSAQDIENRYGFNQDTLRSAKRKTDAPKVEIFFDNTNPKAGEKVTATAVPEFFKNDQQNLYYTWYIVHTADGTPQTAKNSIKAGKLEAAKIMAHGDYDPKLDGQTYSSDSSADPDSDGWPAVDSNSYDVSKTQAPMGGADGVGGLAEEYVDPYSSGNDYCTSEYGTPSPGNCDYYSEASYTSSTSYNLLKYSSSNNQSDHWCNECWADNHIPDTVSSSGTTCVDNRNKCCHTAVDDPLNPTTYDYTADYCSSCGATNCNACFSDYKSCNGNKIANCLTTKLDSCAQAWDANHAVSNNEEIYTNVSRCYKHKFGESQSTTAFQSDDSTGLDFPVKCVHKFPSVPGYAPASGKFTTGEEKLWGTDPNNPDTDGDGINDGAAVIGLGHSTFTWNYQSGDRVGVVVEGTSMIPTDEKNAYYKIMWGYPDTCDSTKVFKAKDNREHTDSSGNNYTYVDLHNDDLCSDSGEYGYGFLATKSPNEESTGERLKVSLSFTPDNPAADPSAENSANISTTDGTIADADQITVSSSLDNTSYDTKNLFYTWKISKNTDLSNDNWKPVADSNFSLSSSTSGLGATDLTFSPKKSALTEDTASIIYFKVTLTVSTTSTTKKNSGLTSVIIPVNKNGIRIAFYKVNIADGKASADSTEVCTEGLYKMMCPAAHDQLLAAKVTSSKYLTNTDLAWSLDGQAYSITSDMQKYFTGLGDNTIIFPVSKDEQETEEVSVTATPQSELAPVTGSRTVTVVTPAVFIKAEDPSVSWNHTYTINSQDAANTNQEIGSPEVLDALTNSVVSYRASFLPDYLLQDDSNVKIDWLLNGVSINDADFYTTNPLGGGTVTLSDNDKVFTFPTSDVTGTYYSLGASIKKYWSADEKSILSTVWGLTPQNLSADKTVTIGTVESMPLEAMNSQNNPSQMLAAIGTHLPHYLMYNLRLALTILVMFFLSAGFYALSLKFSLYEKE